MYRPIEPLTQGCMDLAVEELRGLESVWRERKSDLEAGGELADFLLRLKRDWAIETGIVERLYDWERGVTEVLIEQGVSASLIAHSSGLDRNEAEHARAMIEDHLEIVNWLFEVVKGVRPITEHLIRSLHQMFARHQDYCEAITTDGQLLRIPLVKDAYKNQPNNPRRANGQLHEYCPPELVSDEMQRLVAWHDSSPHGYTTDSLRSILSRTATDESPGRWRVWCFYARALFRSSCARATHSTTSSISNGPTPATYAL